MMPIEVDYRKQILEVRADTMHRINLNTFLQQTDLDSLTTDVLLITGIPTGISAENLSNALHLITHVNGLPLDAEQTFVSINEGTWSRYPNGNLTNIYIKLSEPIKFVHNGQRRIQGLSPWVFEVMDLERIPGPHERKGQFKGKQIWYAQAVEMCRLEFRS